MFLRLCLFGTLSIFLLAASGCVPNTSTDEEVVLCEPTEVMMEGVCVTPDASDMPSMKEEDMEDMSKDMDLAELPRALPLSCWLPPGSYCDPRNPTSCDVQAGETCDAARTQDDMIVITCLPGPNNTQQLGESCDATTGPFCGHGLRCAAPGVCKAYCCDNSDCTKAGQECKRVAGDAGTLGVCDTKEDEPMCVPPGSFCQKNQDCCSNHCHSGHCH